MSWPFSSPKATEVLLHVFGICLCFQGVSFPVSSVPFVCIYMLTWGVHYLGYAMLRHAPPDFENSTKELKESHMVVQW